MRIDFTQGKRGKWRWNLYNDINEHEGVSSVKGFATKYQAEQAAKRCFGESVLIVGTSEGTLFAGERDFDHN